MRFTSDELLFLTSITKGPAPFGVFFDKVNKKNGAEKGKAAKEALIEKGFLTENEITSKGYALLKLWEEYRNAERFVVIKNNIIGLLPNRRCLIIYRDKEGFEMASGDRAEILHACLKEYSFIRRADKKDNVTLLNVQMDYESFRKKANTYGENILGVGYFAGDKTYGQERFFYWDDENIFAYNPHEQLEQSVEPSSVRAYIMEALEINMEVLANGR